jgi:hypothetical protein
MNRAMRADLPMPMLMMTGRSCSVNRRRMASDLRMTAAKETRVIARGGVRDADAAEAGAGAQTQYKVKLARLNHVNQSAAALPAAATMKMSSMMISTILATMNH